MSKLRSGEVLRGQRSLTHLDQFALTDKIINIKLIRQSGEYITIRSDYEVSLTASGSPFFMPVKVKPHISISYNQVSNQTAISLVVKLTNLNLVFDSANQSTDRAEKSLYARMGDPVVRAEIQMGYRSQFPDWSRLDASIINLKDFYSLAKTTILGGESDLDTALRLQVKVLTIYPEGLPPDNVTVLECVVGNLEYGLNMQSSAGKAIMISDFNKSANNFPQLPRDREEPYTTIEKTLFTVITRRFFRQDGFTYRIIDDDVRVLDYDEEEHKFVTDKELLQRPIEQRWSRPLELEDGLLSVEDAIQLGVICSVSDKVMHLSNENRLAGSGSAHGTVKYAREREINVALQTYLGRQVQEFCVNFNNTLRYFQMVNGNLFFYSSEESIEEVVDSYSIKRSDRQKTPLLLPAVYDITIDVPRVIRCPFIGFISPMQVIGFSSKYNIGSAVGFFYPQRKHSWFRVILSDVTFDTTGDDNQMILHCVDASEPVLPDAESKEEKGTTEKTIKRIREWVKIPVGTWVSWDDATKTLIPDTWTRFIQVYVLNKKEELCALSEDAFDGSTLAQGFEYLMSNDDNKGLNDKWYKQRGKAEFVDTWPELAKLKPGRLLKGDELYIPITKLDVQEA